MEGFGRALSKYHRTVLFTMMMFKLGLLCTAAADKCLSSPCNNGATCLDHMDTYVCVCPKGPVWYMGKNCDNLYDACLLAPCANCSSTPGTGEFTCHCPEGYTGLNCTQDVDECHSNPCEGVRSHCVDGVNAYSCHCPLGTGGEDCQENVPLCSEETCQNDGTCVDVPDVGYRCQCAPGYQGEHCEENIDECQHRPCQNGAICKDEVNAYRCFCVPGFQGSHCDLDINECASQPCYNNATCVDKVDHYSCECVQGFKGNNCEVEVDECELRPCQNGAMCHDYVGMYICECVMGFQGQDCEVNIDECASMPCMNGGNCSDLVNSYECVCEGTGFTGDRCEEDIPECASDPCQNGATCLEGVSLYSCLCFPGYEGENCQVDINECELSPCENEGECFQRSQTSCTTACCLNSVPATFRYEESAGFICHCQPGFTGDDCSVNVDECESGPCQNGGSCEDQVNSYRCLCPDGYTGVHCGVDIDECESEPCQNGATCEDGANSYMCHCPKLEPGQEPWGGHDCDILLVGCQVHQCQHEGTCVPMLTLNGEHSYTCLCPPGWTGEHCNTSTTFSFSTEGYILIQLPAANNRTRREADPNDHNHGLHIKLRFKSTLPDMVLYYRGSLERFVSLELVRGKLQARVKSGKVLQVIHPQLVNDGQWHQVTVTMDERLVLVVKGPGCEMGDGCTVKNEGHNQLFFLQPGSIRQLYVGGAPQKYLAQTASGQGFIGCMEDFQVEHRLLLPKDLHREENRGMELGCNKKDWCQENSCSQRGRCVDLWVRASCECHRPYHGESCEQEYPSWTFSHENTTSYASFEIWEGHGDNFTISFFMRSLQHNGLLLQLSREGKAYLTIYLKEGTVALYSPYTTVLSESHSLTRGNNELLTVKVRYGHVVFPEAGDQRALGNVSVEAGDVVHVGGLPAGENIASWGGYFKGCLQDIRIDHKYLSIGDHPEVLEVYRASTMDNVLEGCQTDQTCKGEPCLNEGECHVTWNDFVCNCTVNFSGRTCETRLWCVDSPCFEGGQCVELLDGYECLTEATFQDNAIQYGANSSLVSPVTSITMDIRTRDESAVLLRATGMAEVFCLGLLNSTLLVKLLSRESPELLAFTSEMILADGAWHTIHLAMADPTQPVSRWRLTVDGQRSGGSLEMGGNLNFLNTTSLWLAENFTGCIGEVRVGGVYLPLIDVPASPQTTQFFKWGGYQPTVGCHAALVCDSQPCLNQGICQDQFNDFNCSCVSGWEGELCQTETNECSSAPCVYGTCTDQLADYYCECQPGYMGRNCQEELDNCLEFPCENGGTCLDALGAHSCTCPLGYSGKRCQWRFPPVACDANIDCLNGGVCIGGPLGGNCTCRPGYTGDRCETEIDECASNPCLNGGTCVDRLNHFQCICVLGFSGRLCDSNKLGHKERVPWLVVAIPLTTLCVLLVILAVFFLIMTARKKRQSEGTYSPSTQEVAGARLEMGSVLKVPPEERLI
ncbi:protein crumbs homolog 1-like [Lampris incognitus]|uniref:protein crumbs homolog 1-like n=1 Tax=Lampris incognitus TaxID=2546036 RepID=UPI0024B61A97|nr:protein crumbs homolog 1-like [Lampris incognitus]